MKKLLIIKNGVLDIDKILQQIILSIDSNIKIDVMQSYDLVLAMNVDDCLMYDAIIICGGNQSLIGRHDKDYSHDYLNKLIDYTKIWIENNMCILGICLGAQIVGEACGFKTTKLDHPVIGYQQDIRINKDCKHLLLDESFSKHLPHIMCYHLDFLLIDNKCSCDLKIDAHLCMKTQDGYLMIPYAFGLKNTYAVQFHPEMNDELLCQLNCLLPSLEIKDDIYAASMEFFNSWMSTYLS